MVTDQTPQDHDQLQLLLGICEDFFSYASPATRAEVGTLLRRRGITGGPGWLIDMLGLTRLRLQQHANDARTAPTLDLYDGLPASSTNASAASSRTEESG